MSKANVKVTDVVLVSVDPRQNNGADFAPALVVAVNAAENEGNTSLNVRVFHDGEEVRLVRNVPLLTAKEAEEDGAPEVYAKKA